MANEIEIANLALTRVGGNLIVSFDGASLEAQNCKALYGFARDAVFRDHDWSFARKYLALTLLDETHPEWRFVYATPADCAAARRIHNPHSKDPRDALSFECGISVSGNFPTVLTNRPDAVLIYTARIMNTSAYDAAFCDALGWRLAAELVQPLRADSQLATSMSNRYLQVLSSARAITSNESKEPEPRGGDYTDARGGYWPEDRRRWDSECQSGYPQVEGLITG